MSISFRKMTAADVPLYLKWAEYEHVKSVWFIDGYEPPELIHEKIEGNGYDLPYIILCDQKPIGYLMASDLDAYHRHCPEAECVHGEVSKGTFSIDLFIGEAAFLNRGLGTEAVSLFAEKLFQEYGAHTILIDPSTENKRAIRCYEKAGFSSVRVDHDGTESVLIMKRSR